MKKKYLYIGIGLFLVIIVFAIIRKFSNSALYRSIISFASDKIGEEETGIDAGFKNESFENEMKSVGWKPGYQWCAYFAKLIWTKALPSKHIELAKSLMSGSSQDTFNKFKKDTSGKFEVSQIPKPGGLVVWQSKNNTATGHIGIVKSVQGSVFETIEGNWGGKVVELKRSLNIIPSQHILKGFVNIK